MRAKLLALGAFTFVDALISFMLPTNHVGVQTIYALMKISMFLIFLDLIKTEALELRFLKLTIRSYWIAFAGLYLVNLYKWPAFNDWVDHFNDYETLLPFFVGTTLFIVFYSIKNLK